MSPEDRSRGLAEHWRRHYAERHARVAELGVAGSLDYSNERVRLQTYASLLEGLGELSGRRVLDAGCGWGSLSLALHGFGAEVIGVDLVAATVVELRRRYPFIDWREADLADPASIEALPAVDEVLQYVPFDSAAAALWRLLSAGGRLVAAVPNAECPIAQGVRRRQEGRWQPVSPGEIRAAARRLGVREVWMRGLDFRSWQTFQPYLAGDWSQGDPAGSPNRLVFVWMA